jgi:hypothetical protein
MAIWRNAEIETIVAGPLDQNGLTEEAMNRLVTEGTSESDVLDFKRQIHEGHNTESGSWTKEQEFAKDVAMFANARGGLIIYGILDEHGVAVGIQSMQIQDAEGEERRLRQALRNYVSPFVIVDFIWIEAESNRKYLALVIPPSRSAPHGIAQSRGESRAAYCYPVRHGADTMWLTESEVAERYRRRYEGIEEGRVRVRKVVYDGILSLRPAPGTWQFVAVVPDATRQDRLDGDFVEATRLWYVNNRPSFFRPNQTIEAFGRAIPAPGRVTFTGSINSTSEDETEIRAACVELHVDGSGFAALPIHPAYLTQDARRFSVLEDAILEFSFLMIDLLTKWCVHRVGSWGTASVISGFVNPSSETFEIHEPISLTSTLRSDIITPVPGTRQVRGRPRTDTVIDLSAVDTPQRRLAVTYLVTSCLLQCFGRAEADGLTVNGEIVIHSFHPGEVREIKDWCVRNEVSTK